MLRPTLLLLCALALQPGTDAQAQHSSLYLDALDLRDIRQGWGSPQRNRSVMGNAITIAGRRFARGIGTHAVSRWGVVCKGYARFHGFVGVDDEMRGHPGSVEFVVAADNRVLWKSGVLRVGDSAREVTVDLGGATFLSLSVTDGGDGVDSDHADWADAELVSDGPVQPSRMALLGSGGLEPTIARPAWAAWHPNAGAASRPLKVAGREYAVGIGTQGGSDLIFSGLSGRYERFETLVGADDASPDGVAVGFRVLVDGKEVAHAMPRARGTGPARVSVPLHGADELRLITSGPPGAIADWCEATVALARTPAVRNSAEPAKYVVRSPALTSWFSASGTMVRISGSSGGRAYIRTAQARTQLSGCNSVGPVVVSRHANGALAFAQDLVDPVTANRCTLTDTYTPTPTSIRWETRITGKKAVWSTAIRTTLDWPVRNDSRMWTAWADPRAEHATGWSDPCRTVPVGDMALSYGAPTYHDENPMIGYVPFRYDIFSIPILTFLDLAEDIGLSLVLSPEDTTFDMTLQTDARGHAVFTRLNNRLSPGTTRVFRADLVPHAADWRPGLAWMARTYPRFFDPIPAADRIAGTGAYSTFQGNLDLPKMRKMGFRVNWQASYEFPYMGMFLPPVGPTEEWTNFRNVRTSMNSLESYYLRMRECGFYVLAYFNVTEFGAYLKLPSPATLAGPDMPDDWKDADTFLTKRLRTAILPGPDGKPIGSWEGAVAMDPGDAAYGDYLVTQIGRHLTNTPSMAGICIDRMDWLRLYNRNRDDGLSLLDHKPVASLLVGWNNLLPRIAALLHRHGKALYVNNHTKRLDALHDVDGFYDEFGYNPASLNTTALLGVRKPVLAWTAYDGDLRPDPDAFFQRHLHMGAFPTAPCPGNDHSILPSEWAEKWYMDYGPLLDRMVGKKWVLLPHLIRITAGRATVNVFQVPGGYTVSVTFGTGKFVRIVLHGLPGIDPAKTLFCEALHPGAGAPVPVKATRNGTDLILDVPIVRGCAMVSVRGGGPNRPK